jgi:hypothetical protein
MLYPYYPPGPCQPWPGIPPNPATPGLTIPAITHCKLDMQLYPSTVNLIQNYIPINLSVFFNTMTNLEVLSGSYLATNNTLTLATGITTNPNFVLLITDSPTNLTITNGSGTIVNQNPVTKCYFNAMVANTAYGITSITLDGTTTAPVPQSQIIAVNYTLVYGTGLIN